MRFQVHDRRKCTPATKKKPRVQASLASLELDFDIPKGKAWPGWLWLAFLSVGILTIPRYAFAQLIDADWKYYAGGDLDGKGLGLFYDAKGLWRHPDGHIEVWSKVLFDTDIERVSLGPTSDAIASRVERKVAAGYVPPYSAVEKLDKLASFSYAVAEDVADTGNIEPDSETLVEIDCGARLRRTLSIHDLHRPSAGAKDTPGEWHHVAPGTFAGALDSILCPRS